MSAIRYSGEIRIRVTYVEPKQGEIGDGTYRCFLKRGDASTTVTVDANTRGDVGVDSPAGFDDAARAAVTFAEDDADGRRCAGEDYDSWGYWSARTVNGGYHVGRSEKTACPSPAPDVAPTEPAPPPVSSVRPIAPRRSLLRRSTLRMLGSTRVVDAMVESIEIHQPKGVSWETKQFRLPEGK